MLKGICCFVIYILSVVLFIPVTTVIIFDKIGINEKYTINNNIEENEENVEEEIINDIEFNTTNNINSKNNNQNFETNELEEYIVGVVAAEMPVSFEEEALKAQAIAARTYAYKRIDNINEKVNYKEIGQAYNSIEEMKAKWGSNFDVYYNKIKNAVYETKGMIMTYEDEPIEAVFHSTSAGITEVSENIWGRNLPYIQSVDSKVDENAPNFIYTTKIENSTIINEISKKFSNIEKNNIIKTFEIKKRSDAGYVLEVEVCGEIISGRDIRTMFNLRSTNFTIKKNNDSIEFTTKGYGHGAGMSQYGANFMAQNGKNYIEILNHYYKDILIKNIY